MHKSQGQMVEDIRKILLDVEGINLTDKEAWEAALDELKQLNGQIPSSMHELSEVMDRCAHGLSFLARKSTQGSGSLVEAISEALISAEDYVSGDSNGDVFIRKACRMLNKALEESPQEGTESLDAGDGANREVTEPEMISLNDVAAFLVQMEPDDMAKMKRLVEMLDALKNMDSYSESARALLAEAALMGNALVRGDISDMEGVVGEIGSHLEKIMDATAETFEDTGENQAELQNEAEGKKREESSRPAEEPATEPVCGSLDSGQASYALPEDADMDLLAEFITESGDLIEAAEEALLALETDPEDREAVGTIFRAFHTIKGVSAFLELMAISEMAHHAESLLSRVRDREIRYGGGYADLALRSLDMIKHMVLLVQGALEGESLYQPEGYSELMEILANPEEAGISDEFDGREAAVGFPRIGDLLVAEGKAAREKVEAAAASGEDTPIGVKMVQSDAAKVEDVAHALRTQRSIKGTHVVDSSVRVSTSRLDRLIEMVGELVIAHSMVAQDKAVVNGNNYELSKKVSQTSKIVRELQTLGMSMRMIPLRGTFKKMTRLVRDVSRKVGKNVNLVTEGEETEIDRNMVDIINDPLMHMVRNSVDHGIESPDERERLGKPRQGLVRLSAYHSAGSVVVEIADDGKGLDRDSILAKAREKKLVGEDVTLSEREIFNLVFEPGFSTAAQVTDVSGRGVGMDVVKKNIDSLRGQVEIESVPGKGSIFRMSLPLTLAIIDGMVVRVGNETYIIPTVSIVRSIKPEEHMLSTVLKQGEMLSIQGHLLPLFQLGKLFDADGFDDKKDNKLVVVVEDDNRKQTGLVIDDLVGRQQIVIKSLGEGMKDIQGISGGAIMPNGQVGLILDVGGVVKLANS